MPYKNKEKEREYQKEYQRGYEQRLGVREGRREYMKRYNSKLEVKAKKMVHARKYRKDNKEKIKELRNTPEAKAKAREYYKENIGKRTKQHDKWVQENPEKIKEYEQKPEVIAKRKEWREENKNKINAKQRERRKVDLKYAIKERIRYNFNHAIKVYSTTGKIMSSKKYGMDIKAIIEHLKPFPEPRENYHIDHIIPLVMFNHDDPKQVRKAWLPENHQWLPREINQWKSDRLIIPMTQEQQDKLLKRLKKEQKS